MARHLSAEAGHVSAHFGEHKGHKIHPHDHSGQALENRVAANWCSGKWLCLTCASKALPKGVWFTGPKCPRPAR